MTNILHTARIVTLMMLLRYDENEMMLNFKPGDQQESNL